MLKISSDQIIDIIKQAVSRKGSEKIPANLARTLRNDFDGPEAEGIAIALYAWTLAKSDRKVPHNHSRSLKSALHRLQELPISTHDKNVLRYSVHRIINGSAISGSHKFLQIIKDGGGVDFKPSEVSSDVASGCSPLSPDIMVIFEALGNAKQ